MASVMNVKESKVFCDEVYAQLSDMREKIIKLRDRSVAAHPGKEVEGGMFGRHLGELADQIEWKLQILSHSCTIDWKGSEDYAEVAQVKATEKLEDIQISPGDAGW